jgi:hypothetical protein
LRFLDKGRCLADCHSCTSIAVEVGYQLTKIEDIDIDIVLIEDHDVGTTQTSNSIIHTFHLPHVRARGFVHVNGILVFTFRREEENVIDAYLDDIDVDTFTHTYCTMHRGNQAKEGPRRKVEGRSPTKHLPVQCCVRVDVSRSHRYHRIRTVHNKMSKDVEPSYRTSTHTTLMLKDVRPAYPREAYMMSRVVGLMGTYPTQTHTT